LLQLYDAGLTKTVKHGIKLLGGQSGFSIPSGFAPLDIEVSRASAKAIELIESVPGGKVTAAHYNRLALRVLLKPQKFEDRYVPKRADPRGKKKSFYTSYEKRGELSIEKQMEKMGL